MNRLPDAKRAAILRCLTEGTSVRATARITGTAKATVLKLLAEAERIEADQIWAFVGAKQKNAKHAGQGDIWTFTAIDPDSKLMLAWLVGDRSQESATAFMCDNASRVSGKIQLSTDGNNMYLTAVRAAFSWRDVDYAQVVKSFRQQGSMKDQRRYSPATCTGVQKVRIIGSPNPDLVSTSMVERNNLTLRTTTRRFTRLTSGYSRKAENHAHAVSLAFMAYNFCTPHGTLTKARGGIKTTPAMAAGVTDRVWKIEDVLARMDPDYVLQ